MPHARSRSSNAPKPNRSDLTKAPVVRIPGQGYGEQAQQVVAQQAIPSGLPQPAQPQQASPPTPTPASSPGVGGIQSVLGTPLAGANGSLTRPTERPNEPVTTGLPQGPGAGPEALNGVGAAARQSTIEQGTLAHLLTSLAAQPNATSAIKDLAARAVGGVT